MGEKKGVFNKALKQLDIAQKRMNLHPYLTPYTKVVVGGSQILR